MPLGVLDLHLWPVRLGAPDHVVSACEALLSPEEKERARRFIHDRNRCLYTLSHGVLRILLARYLDTSARQVEFRFGPAGKPSLADPAASLQFNLSHSGDLAVIALAHGCRLGVDIEHVKRVADMQAIASRFFSPEESEELQSVDPRERPEALFRCWTRKEAYLKALGDGLSAPLHAFQVTLRSDEKPRLVRTSFAGGPWQLHHFAPAEDYLGAIAYEGRERSVSEWPLTTPLDLLSPPTGRS